MRETIFIEQHKDKWAEYETLLQQPYIDPDRLREMFVHITDDLAYARTFYPNRMVRYYLNGLAQRIFNRIHRSKRQPLQRVLAFWTEELPYLMWQTRRALWLSFGIFVLAFIIGVISSQIDPDFARYILGDDYVEMTLANIEAGDPMAVYKEGPPLGMSMGIAFNNIFVALLTALSGVLSAIGTVLILIRNGIMVGVFQYFFIERDLFWPSFLSIWIHGTLEISAIVVAGAAGLVTGSGLLFPGTYTRRQAFQRSARQGIRIFTGLIPVFLLAAFFEGYLTRHTEAPEVLRLSFIAISLLAVLGYFVWYPWWKARRGHFEMASLREPVPMPGEPIFLLSIKSNSVVLVDAFRVLFRQALLLLGSVGGASVLMVLASFYAEYTGELPALSAAAGFYSMSWLDHPGPRLLSAEVLVLAVLTFISFVALRWEMPPEQQPVYGGRWRWSFAAALPLLCGGMLWLGYETRTFLFLVGSLVPLLVGFVLAAFFFGGWSWARAVGSALSLVWSNLFLTGASLVLMWWLMLRFFDSFLGSAIAEFFSWWVPVEDQWLQRYYYGVEVFLQSFALHIVWVMMMLTAAIKFFSYWEKTEALQLREGLERVGNQVHWRKLARE